MRQLYSFNLNRIFNMDDKNLEQTRNVYFNYFLSNVLPQHSLYITLDGEMYYFDGDDITYSLMVVCLDAFEHISTFCDCAAQLMLGDEDGEYDSRGLSIFCELDSDIFTDEEDNYYYDNYGWHLYDFIDGVKLPEDDERSFTVDDVVQLTTLQNQICDRIRYSQYA